jgi:hypothetical protein
MEKKMKMELSAIALMAIMFSALAWMVVAGVGEYAIQIVLFSIPLSIAIVLFGTWFSDGKRASRASSADEANGK